GNERNPPALSAPPHPRGREGRSVEIEKQAADQARQLQDRRAEEETDLDSPHTPRRTEAEVEIIRTSTGCGVASTGFLQAAGSDRPAGRFFTCPYQKFDLDWEGTVNNTWLTVNTNPYF